MKEKTLPRYTEWNDGTYLQLHDRHVFWEVEPSDSEEDIQFEIDFLISAKIEEFKETTGVEVFLLGRSGRHVCVEDTPENSRRYRYLERTANRMADELIQDINNL